MKRPFVLLVNPWIHDFAAYDLWLRPHGLLTLAEYLSSRGCRVRLLDCLDRFHSRLPRSKYARFDAYGCGKFPKTRVAKPDSVKEVERPYFRYGLPEETFVEELKGARPDAVCVTSGMTYWYPGVAKTVEILKAAWPDVPVVLGGIYATLMPEHAARVSGTDHVFEGADLKAFGSGLEKMGVCLDPCDVDGPWFPDYGLTSSAESIAVKTSSGCPFRCTYCAASLLVPEYGRLDPEAVFSHLMKCREAFETVDVAFYDDALLVNAEEHGVPLLERLVRAGSPFRFHAPNGLHARFLDGKIARLMREAGFKTVRLSLETADPALQKSTGNKVSCEDLEKALGALSGAGFARGEIGVYVMLGLPGRSPDETEEDAEYVAGLGARPILASFSPIPGTPMWSRLLSEGVVSETTDPLWHNNTIFPLRMGYDPGEIGALRKRLAAPGRNAHTPGG